MRKIGKEIELEEIKKNDIIDIVGYANDCLIYNIDDKKIYFIPNISSNDFSQAERICKSDIIRNYKLIFQGKMKKIKEPQSNRIDWWSF